MDYREFELRLEDFVLDFHGLFLRFCEANPDWIIGTGCTLTRVAVETLRHHIEDPLRLNVSWENAVTMIPIVVELTDDLKPLPFTVDEDDLRNRKTMADGKLRSLDDIRVAFALRALTRGITVLKVGDTYRVWFPDDVENELKKLPRKRRAKRWQQLLVPEVFSLGFTMKHMDDGKVLAKVSTTMEVRYHPLYIDYDVGSAFYPMTIRLIFTEGTPKDWKDEWKDGFWQGILEALDGMVPEENRECLSAIIADAQQVEVMVSEVVSPENADKYEEGLKRFAAFQAWHVENTGKLIPFEGSLWLDPRKVDLSDKQEHDHSKHKYLRYDRIHIPGDVPMLRRNLVVANERRIEIPDQAFQVLLRLVVELKKRKGGWVYRSDLKQEGIVEDERRYQPYSELRKALKAALPEKAEHKLIETGSAKRLRLSTHPDFVTYDKKRLEGHPDPVIARLAKELPRSRKPKK